MQLKTMLNRVERFKSFVYGKARWVEETPRPTVEVQIEPRKNGRSTCSGCGHVRPGYDRLPPRRFEFVPLWGIAVYFVYAMRRVDCPTCGVKVEQVPWCDGKHHLTTTYRWFLAGSRQTPIVAGGRLRVSHHLAERLSLGRTRGFVGLGPSRFEPE